MHQITARPHRPSPTARRAKLPMICLCGHRAAPGRAEPGTPQELSRKPGLRDKPRHEALPVRCQGEPVHVVRRPYTGSAGSWSSQNIATSASMAGNRGGAEAEAAAIERGEKPLPHRAILTPVFCCGVRDFWTWYRAGHIALFCATTRRTAAVRGAPRPQRNPHTPGATHDCMRRTLSRTVLARADDVNTEKVTHACAPRSEALTHARSPSASQLPAARASPRASAAQPSWLRSAPQPLPSPL